MIATAPSARRWERLAASLSDVAIVTSDNPRTEDPEAIIEDIEEGLKKTGRPYVKLTDRREAIFHAIEEAREGDVVLIAGKGHETYQIIGQQKNSLRRSRSGARSDDQES